MTQQIVEEKCIVLRNQIRIAIALYLLNSCSENRNMRDYIEEIQNVYRIKSKKCNLPLERKVFLQQMVLLLPKSDDFQSKPEPLPTPMEVDVDGKLDPIYEDFALKLMMVTEFLDGLYVLQTVLKLESISSEDIFRILTKFGDSDFNFCHHNSFRTIKISINAAKQCLKHMNIKKIAKECIFEIIKLFEIYLKDLPPEQSLSSEEALAWMKRANIVVMKCIDSFAYEGQYQDIIVNFLYESVDFTFIQEPKNLHYELYRYHLIRKWRYHKLLCTNALNIFINNLRNIEEKMDELDKKKYIIILKFTKLFLETFCEIHFGKSILPFLSKDTTTVAKGSSSNRNKNHAFPSDKKCLKTWGKCLGSLITPKCRSATIISLAYSCTKVISSTKDFQKR